MEKKVKYVNDFPFENKDKWEIIQKLLKDQKINNINDLKNILSKIKQKLDPIHLVSVIESLKDDEKEFLFNKVLPLMIEFVLKTKEIFENDKLPLLNKDTTEIKLSRMKIFCILSNSFFCTFDRASDEESYIKKGIPSINMDEVKECFF
jgi:hypothetical protein